jgi:hypothetical protein
MEGSILLLVHVAGARVVEFFEFLASTINKQHKTTVIENRIKNNNNDTHRRFSC